MRHKVVRDATLEDCEVASDGRPVPTNVCIPVEGQEVVLHLSQPSRREAGPAKAVRRHELAGDAIEDPSELIHTTESRQLRMDMDVDEAGGDSQALRVDGSSCSRTLKAADRGHTISHDANV